jgi:hypothetical protein
MVNREIHTTQRPVSDEIWVTRIQPNVQSGTKYGYQKTVYNSEVRQGRNMGTRKPYTIQRPVRVEIWVPEIRN